MENSKFYDILCINQKTIVDDIETDEEYPMKRKSGEYAIEFILRCLKGNSARAKYYKEWATEMVKQYLELKSERKETKSMGEEDMTSKVSSLAYNRALAIKQREAKEKAEAEAKLKAIADANLKKEEGKLRIKEGDMMGKEDKLAKTRATNLKQATLRKDIATLPPELKQNILDFIDTKLSEKDKSDLKELFTSTDYYASLISLVENNPTEAYIPKKYQKEAGRVYRQTGELKNLIEKVWLDGTGEELDPDKDKLYYDNSEIDYGEMEEMGLTYSQEDGYTIGFDKDDFENGIDKIENRFLPNIERKVMAIGKKVLKPDLPKSVVKARAKAKEAKEAKVKVVAEKATIGKVAPYGLTKSGKVRTKPLGSNKKEKTGVGIGGGYINY